MDFLEGGELLDRILSKRSFNEKEASEVLEVIAATIKYLHENGVCILLPLSHDYILYNQ